MKKLEQVICLDFTGDELDSSLWHIIDQLSEKRLLTAQQELAHIPKKETVEGLLVKLGAKIDQKVIDLFPSLKYIGMLGTGYGGIDIAYASSKGITVTNIADYATEAVTEFTFGILLEYYRAIAKARTQAKAGNYSDDFGGGEIKGKKFGVIGLGDIGTRTAQLAQAFGAEVNYWSRNRKEDVEATGITYTKLDDLIAQSDVLTVNLALNLETEGILNATRIKKIKSHAIMINPSPMELFDFEALLERLKQNDMVFMLDHSDEMTDEKLRALQSREHVIIYPAIAYLTTEASLLKKRIYVDNIKNFLDGRPTNNVN